MPSLNVRKCILCKATILTPLKKDQCKHCKIKMKKPDLIQYRTKLDTTWRNCPETNAEAMKQYPDFYELRYLYEQNQEPVAVIESGYSGDPDTKNTITVKLLFNFDFKVGDLLVLK